MNSETYTYALITTPGLEKACMQELESKWCKYFKDLPYEAKILGKGLVEVTSSSTTAILLNQILRIPTRILLRLTSFKCRDFPKLFNKSKKLNWGNVLYSDQFEVKASSKKSKLIHTGRIEKTISDGIKFWLKGNPRKKSTTQIVQKIFIRVEDDTCTVSIDTSGEALYKRQERKDLKGASAPLRETISAGIWQIVRNQLTEFDEVVDPMCGSGTILWEAIHFDQVILRGFAFEQMKLFKQVTKLKNASEINTEFSTLGIDQNKNLKSTHEQYSETSFIYKDFFKVSGDKEKKRIFLCNPPYGERLQKGNSLRSLYHKMIEHCFVAWDATAVGILIPSTDLPKTQRNIRKYSLINGGISVTFMLMERD